MKWTDLVYYLLRVFEFLLFCTTWVILYQNASQPIKAAIILFFSAFYLHVRLKDYAVRKDQVRPNLNGAEDEWNL